MKIHTTNYRNTFIEVSEDTGAVAGTKPMPRGDKKTVAEMQYDLIQRNPYTYTSDDVLFQVFAERNDLTSGEYPQAREQFFSKGQACLRTSPLSKTYGFGIHCDDNEKIALYGVETPEYKKFAADNNLKKVKGMQSKKQTRD